MEPCSEVPNLMEPGMDGLRCQRPIRNELKHWREHSRDAGAPFQLIFPLTGGSQSAVEPGCGTPGGGLLCEMVREFRQCRSPRWFRTPISLPVRFRPP